MPQNIDIHGTHICRTLSTQTQTGREDNVTQRDCTCQPLAPKQSFESKHEIYDADRKNKVAAILKKQQVERRERKVHLMSSCSYRWSQKQLRTKYSTAFYVNVQKYALVHEYDKLKRRHAKRFPQNFADVHGESSLSSMKNTVQVCTLVGIWSVAHTVKLKNKFWKNGDGRVLKGGTQKREQGKVVVAGYCTVRQANESEVYDDEDEVWYNCAALLATIGMYKLHI